MTMAEHGNQESFLFFFTFLLLTMPVTIIIIVVIVIIIVSLRLLCLSCSFLFLVAVAACVSAHWCDIVFVYRVLLLSFPGIVSPLSSDVSKENYCKRPLHWLACF